MNFIEGIPVWTLALAIFSLRIFDVSLGTIRTISVVNGRMLLSVCLGFFEILVWVTAISQLILQVREHPVLLVAYAGGFATGNAFGIFLERRMALGQCVVRMISREGERVAGALPSFGRVVGLFRSDLPGDPRSLVFVTLPRRELAQALGKVRDIDPELFYIVERFSETSHLSPLPHTTGWRAIFKKK